MWIYIYVCIYIYIYTIYIPNNKELQFINSAQHVKYCLI